LFPFWEKSYGNKKMSALGGIFFPWDFCLVGSPLAQSPWLKAKGLQLCKMKEVVGTLFGKPVVMTTINLNDKPKWIVKTKNWKPLGDCRKASYDLLTKLQDVRPFPKRVRGFYGGKCKELGIHYWVESKGFVFDTSNNQTIIAPVKEYYDSCEMYNIEYSKNVFGVFEDEAPGNDPELFNRALMCHPPTSR